MKTPLQIAIASLSTQYKKLLAGANDFPVMQFNHMDSKRSGTGNPPPVIEQDITEDDEDETALTFPNTDMRPSVVLDSDINTGADELHTTHDYPSSAPYYAYADKVAKRLASLHKRRQG